MEIMIVILLVAVAAAVGAVIYYRRNTAKVEAALMDAVAKRDDAEKAFNDLKKKVGG
jgi:cell division protein FtsL